MSIYDQRDHAVQRSMSARDARQQVYDGLFRQDELENLEKDFKKNLGLNAVGELAKWNPAKEYERIQAIKQKRLIDIMTIESLDALVLDCDNILSGIRARIKADEQSYETFLGAVRAGLDYSGELMQAAEKRGMERARSEARKSGDSRYSHLMSLRRNLGALTDIADTLGRSAEVADLQKQAGPVIGLLVEQTPN